MSYVMKKENPSFLAVITNAMTSIAMSPKKVFNANGPPRKMPPNLTRVKSRKEMSETMDTPLSPNGQCPISPLEPMHTAR